MSFRVDPGPCIVCGAPHCSCTAASAASGRGKITVTQVRGGPITVSSTGEIVAAEPLLQAERVQATLPAGQFTSGTYRGSKKPRAAGGASPK